MSDIYHDKLAAWVISDLFCLNQSPLISFPLSHHPFALLHPPRLCNRAVSNTFTPDNTRHPEGQSEPSGPRLMSADLTDKPSIEFLSNFRQIAFLIKLSLMPPSFSARSFCRG